MIIVAKVGTSSITDIHGAIETAAIDKLCAEVATLRGRHHRVVVVTSGAIAAGLPALGLSGTRPADLATLQAISAVGQSHLMRVYDDALARHGLVGGQVLLEEMGRYRPDLLRRPRLTVGSKADMAGPEVDWTGDRISAVTGDGVRPLVGRLVQLVEEARAAEPVPDSFVVHEPLPEGFRIEREPSGDFRVVGRPAERVVALSDVTTADAQEYVRHRLQRLGVDRALERAGAREGDTVHIGDMEFEYQPAGSTNR